MSNIVSSRTLIAAVSSSLLTAALLSGSAKAITDTVFKYSTPRTGYLALDVTGFTPLDYTAANGYDIFYVYDGAITTTVDGACFGTSVNLPHGSKMSALSAWFTKGLHISLYRHTPSQGGSTLVADKTFVSGNTTLHGGTITIDTALQGVDNQHYAYGLIACLPKAADTFYGARVAYTYTNAGD